MKELEFTIRVRNNRLKERREKLGLSGVQVAKRCGISATTYCALEGLSPNRVILRKKDGQWTESVLKIAKFYKVDPIELFPASTIAMAFNRAEKKLDAEEIPLLFAGSNMLSLPDEISLDPEEQVIREENKIQLDEIIANQLTDKERYIWEQHFLENRRLCDLARELDISTTRVGQVADTCLRKVFHYRRRLINDTEILEATNRARMRKKGKR